MRNEQLGYVRADVDPRPYTGTGGLGKETVLELAKHSPKHIIFTGRAAGRAEEVVRSAKSAGAAAVTFVSCDLGSLSSVKEAAQRIIKIVDRVDVLVCNAGIMAVPYGLTKDGYEIQFGTNHVGHALLIRLLLPAIQKSTVKRIVNLTSEGKKFAPKGGIQFDTVKTKRDTNWGGAWLNYGQSKLANILYARALAKRYPDITSVAIHPGVVKTDLATGLGFWNSALIFATTYFIQVEPKQGAYNQLWASTVDKEQLINGGFYEPVAETGGEDVNTRNAELADKLWDWTEGELKPYL